MDYFDMNLNGAKVLVVDDEELYAKALRIMLEKNGYEVKVCLDGASALKIIAEYKPDVVLLDVAMPKVNGYDVCKIIKSEKATRLIPVIFLSGLRTKEDIKAGLRAGGDDFLVKPVDISELTMRVRNSVCTRKLTLELDDAEQILFTIANTIEARDANTGEHCERLSSLSISFGKYLGLKSLDLEALHRGGYLHDIGKIAVPDSILFKSGPLNDEEWLTMRQHPIIGENICRPLTSMRNVLSIIRHHHENWNGTGYPDSLKGEDIPLLPRVFKCVDVFDALRMKRPYKEAYTQEKTLNILNSARNKLYDPNILDKFADFLKTHPEEIPNYDNE